MKTRKLNLHGTLLAAAMVLLPPASHAADGAETAAGAYGTGSAQRAEAGPGLPPPADAEGRRHGPGGHAGPGPGFGPGPRPHGAPFGGPFGPHDGPGAMPGPPPFLHGLALSEAQQDKVFAILHAQAPYLREQGKALQKSQQALHAMGSAAQYDDAKAVALAQAAAQAMSNLTLQHVRSEQKLLAVLTPEQRKQFDQRMAVPPHP
ncbi:MAG: Spy/CpxP family protein refolding chaperone [Pseudomonadota bacterium]